MPPDETRPAFVANKGAISDTEFRTDRTDVTTHVHRVIDHAHSEIHNGQMFSAWVYDSDFDTQAQLILAFRTPNNTSRSHLFVEFSTTSFSAAEILEAPTITSGTGTVVLPHNRDRNSLLRSGMMNIDNPGIVDRMTRNPTITVDNVVLHGEMIGGGKNHGGSVGSSRGIHEWKLLPNTLYACRLTQNSVGSDNQIASIFAVWYEHVDRS